MKAFNPVSRALLAFVLFLVLFAPGEDKTEKLSPVHFVKLALRDSSGAVLSTNFYWRGKTEGEFQDLEGMTKGRLTGTASEIKDGKLTVDLQNPTSGIVLMARIKVIDTATGLLVAPVLYSDNYFSLAPNESRRIDINLKAAPPNRQIKLVVEGWNIDPVQLS